MSATRRQPQVKASGLHGALMAATYNRSMWFAERAGMAERRRALLAQAGGRVLELGAGTGMNLARYPTGIDELVLTEPDAAMARHLRRHVKQLGSRAEVVRTTAESLPFADGSFDVVVSTLVLCTVDDPTCALREIRRVLGPGGRLLFLEHVRSDEQRLARWQDRLHGLWRGMFCGCNCNRATLDLIRGAGFETAAVERAQWRRMPPLVRPLVSGSAGTGG